MKQMVNAFSEYARTPRMEVSRFDVNALITELRDLYAHQEKPLAIKLALARDLPLDRGRRGASAASAAQSAAQRARSDGASGRARAWRSRRAASSSADSDLLEIKVADNGPGFLGDIVHQAFEPYVTSKPKGTGLGSRHRQEARRRARRPDQRAQPRAGRSRDQYTHSDIGGRRRSVAQSAPRSQERTRMSARILVVDDEANIRALIDEILSEEGYDVTTAADAKEARSARKRARLRSRPPRHLDAGHRRHLAASRVVGRRGDGHRRHDVGPRHRRHGRRGHASRRRRFRREARLAREAAAHRGKSARRAPQQGRAARRRARRTSPRPARARRYARCASSSRASRSTARTRCSRASPAAAASCSRAISRARAHRHAGRSSP